MQFEAFSCPKTRDLSVEADDVFLHIPGRVTAVFDGATDAAGRKVGGVSVGRLAGLAAAQATAALPDDAHEWAGERILALLSAAIGREIPNHGDSAPASTTAMIAFERPDSIRLVGIGDTGFRLNGGPVQSTALRPDQASTPARVVVFKHLLAQGFDAEMTEKMCRRAMSLGLDLAVSDGVITADICKDIISHAIRAAQVPDAAVEIETFLRAGLQSQHSFANSKSHPLRYGVLNGHAPNSDFLIDENIPRDELNTLEIFSDGYLRAPSEVSLAAWEQTHHQLEVEDPHKLDEFPTCKGSTNDAFFDDRTVVILKYK